jgi:hypothetical protein
MTTHNLVLVHSPLVGRYTWEPVAAWFRAAKGGRAVVPDIRVGERSGPPYWQRHVDAVVSSVRDSLGDEDQVTLVAHSGAGVLLPAIGAALPNPVAAYAFVDAIVPRNRMSRFDLVPEVADEFRRLAMGGALPPWSADDLAAVIPDPDARRRLTAGLPSLPLAVYEEPIPVPADWPDAPVAYLHLTEFYDTFAAEARERNWAYRRVDGRHFHMLIDPAAVGEALLRAVRDAERVQALDA